MLAEIFFQVGVDEEPALVKIVEKHFKAKIRDRSGRPNRDYDEFFRTAAKGIEDAHDGEYAAMYRLATKRVADLPAFLEECRERCQLLGDCGDVQEIMVQGDRAAGRTTLPYLVAEFGQPSFLPVHFRKIANSWYFEDNPAVFPDDEKTQK